jgi:uncharacterized protein (TIGR02172 family)
MTNSTSSTPPAEKLGNGRTADVTIYSPDQVLKLYKSWMPASAVEREFRSTQAAFSVGLPVPQPFQLIEQNGCFGIVFEYVHGVSLMQELQQHPWRLRSVAQQLAQLQVQINQTPAPAGLPSQHEQMIRNIDRTNDLSENEKDQIKAVLSSLPEGKVFCHGDFHPDNVLLSPRGPVIIDWLTGASGSAAGDLSRSVMILETSTLPPGISQPRQFVINSFRRRLVDDYRQQYLKNNPQPLDKLARWELPILAARLIEVSDFPREKELILKRIHEIINSLEN